MRQPVALWAVLLLLLGTVLAGSARAGSEDYGLASVSASLSTYQAGAHPDFVTTVALKEDPESAPNPFGLRDSFAATRDVSIDLPPGLVGNPNAVGQCTVQQLSEWSAGGGCPNDSQVGTVVVGAYALSRSFVEPLYLMKPPGDVVARLGFIAGIFPTFIDAKVRSGSDYGITATAGPVSAQQRLVRAETTIWGVPAAAQHDTERQTPVEAFNGADESPPRPPSRAEAPFMTNPTSCGTPLVVKAAADSYQNPGDFSTATVTLEAIHGCDSLAFAPQLTVTPTSRAASAPTGLDSTLTLPQDESPGGRATSQLRSAVVALPQGMAIASGAADGLLACSDAQVGLGSDGPTACPPAAKVASAVLVSPALSEPLQGAVYQRTPEPGRLFGIWLVADGLGVHLKIPGEVRADQATGQLTAVFAQAPQLPAERIELHFKSGARAPLANPPACGTYFTRYDLSPWSGNQHAAGETPMTIDEACGAGGFSPRLSAGVTSPHAGRHSPFVFDLARGDGEQNVADVGVGLPPGELAKLSGVPVCPASLAAAGACPGESRIGRVDVAAGPGSLPLWIPQAGKAPTAVYLAGPYRDAPYSMVVVVPAQAGPFDLGTVVTRAGIYVDPETARASVRSDPLPQILEGVPIQYRRIHVEVDRPGFALNPTSCEETSVDATVRSSQGAVATPSDRFQVGGCASLGFKPKLAMRLFGKTNRGAHPAFRAVLQMPNGDANVARASVALPSSEFLDQAHIRTICTRVQFAADSCPAGSIYGRAVAKTPLLDEPLRGPVYLRSSSHELPDLVADLRGQIHVVLSGRIDSVRGGIRTVFESVPDAPVSQFVLSMKGGAKGLLVNSTNLCLAPHRAVTSFTAQNGRRQDARVSLKSACGKRGGERKG